MDVDLDTLLISPYVELTDHLSLGFGRPSLVLSSAQAAP
jgi:hypothetical protein